MENEWNYNNHWGLIQMGSEMFRKTSRKANVIREL